jgi:hypothetical protein
LAGEEIQLLPIFGVADTWAWVISVTPRPRLTPGEGTPVVWPYANLATTAVHRHGRTGTGCGRRHGGPVVNLFLLRKHTSRSFLPHTPSVADQCRNSSAFVIWCN